MDGPPFVRLLRLSTKQGTPLVYAVEDGTVLFVTKQCHEGHFGVTPRELIGTSVASLVIRADVERIQELFTLSNSRPVEPVGVEYAFHRRGALQDTNPITFAEKTHVRLNLKVM